MALGEIQFLFWAPATLGLLSLFLGISLYAYFVNPSLFELLIFQPASLRRTKRYHTFLTSGVLHGDMLHLAVNAIVFYLYAGYIEAREGPLVLLIFFCGTILLNNIVLYLLYRTQPKFFNLGAGSVVIGAILYFVLLNPGQAFLISGLPVSIPFLFFPLVYLGFLYYAIYAHLDNVNHQSTVAGIIAGLAFTLLRHPELIKLYGGIE